jgi:hypothetical protein
MPVEESQRPLLVVANAETDWPSVVNRESAATGNGTETTDTAPSASTIAPPTTTDLTFRIPKPYLSNYDAGNGT